MFFNKSNDNNKNSELEQRIAVLEKEVEFFKTVASSSQEEMFVVVDSSGTVVFQNDKATSLIQDSSALLRELSKGEDKIDMDHCSGKVKSTQDANGNKFYSIIKSDMRDTRDSNILHMHQDSITESLTDTQSTFTNMLEQLKVMKKESTEIAVESEEGLKLIVSSSTAMDSLSEHMQNSMSGMHS